MKKKIVGISGSLRNKIKNQWADLIKEDLLMIPDRDLLMSYLKLISSGRYNDTLPKSNHNIFKTADRL